MQATMSYRGLWLCHYKMAYCNKLCSIVQYFALALLENADLPSAASFAEWQKSGTRRSHSLPSAGPGGTRQSLALGKEWLCRVPQSARHSAKGGTRQKPSLPSATLGKEWHSTKKWHLTAEPAHAVNFFLKKFFAECRPWHSAKRAFAECWPWNMWRCLGFRHPTSQLDRNLLNFLP